MILRKIVIFSINYTLVIFQHNNTISCGFIKNRRNPDVNNLCKGSLSWIFYSILVNKKREEFFSSLRSHFEVY